MKLKALVLLGLLAAGCDTSAVTDALNPTGDGGPVEVELPLPDDATVGELTTEQKDQICKDLAQAVERAVSAKDKCDVAGVIGSTSAAAEGLDAAKTRCEEIVEPCATAAALGESVAPDLPLESCALFGEDTSTCTVPVGTLKTCLVDVGEVTAATLRVFDCDALSLEDAAKAAGTTLGASAPDSAECLELEVKCPGVFNRPAETDAGQDASPVDAGVH